MSGDLVREDATSEPASENDFEEIGTGKEEASDDMMAEQRPVLLDENEASDAAAAAAAVAKAKADAKDPLRPRRKKARRACFACQRAHLTCGDERPCQRCIKRGLADGCQDGVRKKAKYLHDAPPEALGPVLGPGYQGNNNRASDAQTINISTPTTSPPGINNFFGQPQPSPSYQNQRFNRQSQMAPSLQDPLSYTNQQQSPMSTSTYQSPSDQRTLQGLAASSTASTDTQAQNAFTDPLFDPSNPAMYNFDLEGLNFGNHYGALEFGMLGHMSSGVVETQNMDKSMSQQGNNDGMNYNAPSSFDGLNQFGRMSYDVMIPADFNANGGNIFGNANIDMQGSQFAPHAYSIAAGPTSLPSPSTDANASPQASGSFDSPTGTSYSATNATHSQPRPAKRQERPDKSKLGPQSVMGKRSRDPSSIYQEVKEPYSYTMGFHSLTAFIQKRFSPSKTLRIAKSLASIRPSFISCTKTLNKQDLIFMEKCFQRTLFEYEDFMVHCCTPMLVCRRTGEIAAVNKEFTLLTGWTREVLLGQLPNNNVNTGGEAGGGSGRAGLPTPRKTVDRGQGQDVGPHPVFLAELFDDDSVIEFYEDFAKLAFGDSRGSVTAKCRLLTYQTRESNALAAESGSGVPVKSESNTASGNSEVLGKRKADDYNNNNNNGASDLGMVGNGGGAKVSKIDGENGIGKNLQKDGKMECIYCWTVKRDVFDIPMLIVMNFLPCI